MSLTIVAAVASNYVIGKNGQIPWQGKLPADMSHFKELTLNQTVIMGRKTFESILDHLGRPLPLRTNIVISKRGLHPMPSGITLCSSFSEALRTAKGTKTNIFVIGGGEVYREALPIADVLEMTIVHEKFEGDILFPRINVNDWAQASKRYNRPDDKNKFAYSFVRYERRFGTK